MVNTPQPTRALLAQRRRPRGRRRHGDARGRAGRRVLDGDRARHARRGVASALLARLLTWAWEHGASHAYLQVDAQNHRRAGGVSQVRIRHRVHVSLLRAGREISAMSARMAASTRSRACSGDALLQEACDVRDRRVVHGRTGRRRDHRHRRQLGVVRARLRHLYERGEAGAARRARGDAARARRGVRSDGARDGGGCARAQPRAISRSRSRASRDRAAARPEKPVGMVCFAWAGTGLPTTAITRHFPGDRADVRRAAVVAALEGLIVCAEAISPPGPRRSGGLASNDRSMP